MWYKSQSQRLYVVVHTAARDVIKREHAAGSVTRTVLPSSVRRWHGVDSIRSTSVIKHDAQWPAVRFYRSEERLRRHARDFVNVRAHYDRHLFSLCSDPVTRLNS